MNLGKRMKSYEKISERYALKNTPLIIRADGKAFHTFTRKYCKEKFDKHFMMSMVNAALKTAKQIHGFKLAYIQSDEISFLVTDYDTLQTQPWFNYRLNKIESIVASYVSIYFNFFFHHDPTVEDLAVFDCRAFNVPKNDVLNYFLWRMLDFKRNSLQTYCRQFFSHKELKNKNHQQMHEMLHAIGKNWSKDLTNIEKNGTFIVKKFHFHIIDDINPMYTELYENFSSLF